VLGHSKAFLGWSGSTFSRFVEQMLPADIPVAKFVARSDHCARHVRQSFGDDRFEQLHRSFHAAAKRTATVFRRGVSKRAVGSAACFQVGAPSSGLALPPPSPSEGVAPTASGGTPRESYELLGGGPGPAIAASKRFLRPTLAEFSARFGGLRSPPPLQRVVKPNGRGRVKSRGFAPPPGVESFV
jgi:hypothetical protein